MRQAGKSLAAHRELRDRHSIMKLATTPELCAQVSVMPVDILGVDAAVMYCDIMLPLRGMGIDFELDPRVGPIIDNPIDSAADIERLTVRDSEESTGFVMEAIRLTRQALSDGRAATVGFCGSPYTLACYMIEGRPSRDYVKSKAMMMGEPLLWAKLMDKLTDQMADYLLAQARAGATVVQVFDSWVGALSPGDYERSALPWMKRLFQRVNAGGVPTIYFGTGASSLLERMASAGSTIMSVDWRVNIDEAWARVGHHMGIQGNLDPVRLVAGWEATESATRDVLARVGGRPGHVFSLGHAVFEQTDTDLLRRLVDFVHENTSHANTDHGNRNLERRA
jgi:uroporphyrinogen decarboxylase